VRRVLLQAVAGLFLRGLSKTLLLRERLVFFPPQQLLLDSQILHFYLYPTKKRSKGMLGKSSKLIQIRAFHDENHVLLF